MELTILAVPDCPNAPLLRGRLDEALAGLGRPVEGIREVLVTDGERAEELGMCGSPTLLIDGVDPFADPFAGPGRPAGLSCRLFRDASGALCGAPTVDQLRGALRAAEQQ
ncbi:alkylmercury lyase [Kitasatospora sp. NPDC089509]|uniref:alkylmercury lyase n=1 Tax=Kitasatospora sp. NPDC089509 TaxID=3364079 RepID=UPI00381A93AA